jgi:hypothetical protein
MSRQGPQKVRSSRRVKGSARSLGCGGSARRNSAADQFSGFGVGETLDALLGAEVELDPVPLAFGVDQVGFFKNDTTIIELLLSADADPLAGSPSALETARFFEREELARQLFQHIQRRRSVNV